jgi:hypothetical protein
MFGIEHPMPGRLTEVPPKLLDKRGFDQVQPPNSTPQPFSPQRPNLIVVSKSCAKASDGHVIPGRNPEHPGRQNLIIKAARCHGKRFDTIGTLNLAGRAQRYFVLVRISVVQYELAL